jgi:hypothetical protein
MEKVNSDFASRLQGKLFHSTVPHAIKQGGKTRGAHGEQSQKKNVFKASINGYTCFQPSLCGQLEQT